MIRRNYHFSLILPYDFGDGNEDCHVTGSITPGYPATGPTYACGGTPIDPPDIEDFCARRMIDGKEVEIEDTDAILEDLFDDIMEYSRPDEDGGHLCNPQ